MANHTKYFFLAPTWDYPPPPLGPIKLGNVITSASNPECPLFTALEPDQSEVFTSEKTKVLFSTEKLVQRKFGIYTKFLSILGIGVDAEVEFENNNGTILGFDVIETTQFFPKAAYLEKCIADSNVKGYLETTRYRKPVYVVTGLKVVRGANAKTHQARNRGGKIGVQLDLTAVSGVPVSLGPEFERRAENSTDMAFEGSSDFVFAYRLRKITVQRKDMTVKKNEDYQKGEMLDGNVKDKKDCGVRISEDDESDLQVRGFDMEEVSDGDDQVICAIPQVVYGDGRLR